MSAYRPVVSEEQEADLMSSIFGAMDALPSTSLSRKRKPSVDYYDTGSSSPVNPDHPLRRKSSFEDGDALSDGPWDGVPSSDDVFMSPKKRMKTSDGGLTPAIERMAHMDMHSGSEDNDTAFDNSLNDMDMDAFMNVDDDDLCDAKSKWKTKNHVYPPNKKDLRLTKNTTNPSTAKMDNSTPTWLSVYDSLSVTTEDHLGPLSSNTTIKSSKISALEPDGSLRFFWLDYLEHEGKIYFIGKLKDKTSGAWVSCSVTVEGLQRNLFVLPRERQVLQDEDGKLHETDMVPSLDDVYDDFDRVRKKIGIKTWKGKFVKRKYAFGEVDVPREERQWLKVLYGFNGGFCSSPLIGKLNDAYQSPKYLIMRLALTSLVFLEPIRVHLNSWY